MGNHLKEGKSKEFIKHAVLSKKYYYKEVGTSTGKTTFTNAALGEIPTHERLITAEDAREVILHLKHPNCAHLLSSKGGHRGELKLRQD